MALSNAKIQRREARPLSGRWKDRSLNNSEDGKFLLDWIPWQTRASLVRKERGGHHAGVNGVNRQPATAVVSLSAPIHLRPDSDELQTPALDYRGPRRSTPPFGLAECARTVQLE